MNLAALIPLASQMTGRDITPDVQLFFRARAAVGQALSPEGQDHFIKNWRGLVDYMESEAGQKSLKRFLGNWETDSKAGQKEVESVDQN